MAILGAIPLDLDTAVADLFDSSVMSIATTSSRTGGHSLHAASNGLTSTKNIGSNIGSMNLVFAVNIASNGVGANTALFSLNDAGTAQVSLKMLSDGTIQAYRGSLGTLLGATSPGAFTFGVFQSIEVNVTISATVGVFQVWVNSVSVLNLTAQNTKNTANTTVSAFTLGCVGNVVMDFCDIVWSDGSRIGDVRTECIVPNGAGTHAQFTPSAGANWQNVDEIPPDGDTTFNDTTVVGNIDSFVHAALSASPASILAVIVNVRARNTTTGVGSVAPFIRSSTTELAGTAVALNTSYQNFQSVYATDPATSAAWTLSGVNACEIGYKRTA